VSVFASLSPRFSYIQIPDGQPAPVAGGSFVFNIIPVDSDGLRILNSRGKVWW
jgi:hypothetical protein